jgi:hypothetical protein
LSLKLDPGSDIKKKLLISSLLQLLKRQAESGNDLFGISNKLDEKIQTAHQVFVVLDDLYGRYHLSMYLLNYVFI